MSTPDLRHILTNSDHFPLAKAYLCEDCQEVHKNSQQCPACASKAIVALAGILNREEKESDENSGTFLVR